MNAALSSKKHFRLGIAGIENVGGFCWYAWLVELQMVAMCITMPGSYQWIKDINLWNRLEMEVEIQLPYPVESLDLVFSR